MGGMRATRRGPSIGVIALLVVGVSCSPSETAEPTATSGPTEQTVAEAGPADDATTGATTDEAESTPSSVGAAAEAEPAPQPGEVLGRVELDGPAERVVLAGDLAVVAAGNLVAVERTTLDPVWELDLGSNVRGVGATGDRAAPILATTDDGRVVIVSSAGDEVDEYRHPDLPWDVTVHDRIAWIGGGANRTMQRIDLIDGTTRSIIGTELPLRAVVLDDRVWVLGHERATVTALDLAGDQTDTTIGLGDEPQLWPLTIDAGADHLWAGPSGDQMWRVDPTTGAATRFTVPDADGRFLAVVDERLWFVSTATGELIELDQQTMEVVQRLAVEGRPIGLTGDADRLFVTSLLDEGTALLAIAS